MSACFNIDEFLGIDQQNAKAIDVDAN